MIFPSFIPQAHRITREEAENAEINDRVFGIKFPVKFILAALLTEFVIAIIPDIFMLPPFLETALAICFILVLCASCIAFYLARIKIVTADRRIVSLSSKSGGRISSAPLFAGIGIILLVYAIFTGDKGNAKGAYPLYIFIVFLIIRMLFKFTVKPLFTCLEIRSREKRCTLPVKADLIRNIAAWDEKISESDQQFGSIPMYMYCYAEQFYRIYINDINFIDPCKSGSLDLYIDPERPEKYLIPNYFKTDRADLKRNLWNFIFVMIALLCILGTVFFKPVFNCFMNFFI